MFPHLTYPRRLPTHLRTAVGVVLLLASAPFVHPQSPTPGSSSYSSSSEPSSTRSVQSPPQSSTSTSSTSLTQRVTQPEAAGSAITLESSESLFSLAAALNVCGYDADLAGSSPVRVAIRQQLDEAIAASPEAVASRDALCAYTRQHQLGDTGRTVAQYVSLALYLGPDLVPTVAETELPPDSTQVFSILPLLRNFSEAVHLHAIWIQHHADYDALTARLHDPLTRMILNTNIYLRSPVSSYDGRRFLVLVEPMLAPSAVNARIYSTNYDVVVSPASDLVGGFHLDQIRHTYLHYEIEPMVYARAAAMDRLLPLLKPVADAPLDFIYKSDIVALLTECLIKAVEARTLETGLVKPVKPAKIRERTAFEKYDAEMNLYNRQAEAARRRAVDLDMREGWVLTDYFYIQLVTMEHDNISLKDNIGPMVYGMDVGRQQRAARDITFLPEAAHDVVRRVQPVPTGLHLAETKMMQGDAAGAEELADKALADPAGDHAQAHYILARINLLERQPDVAVTHFRAALDTSKDPRTLAWSHIYLGRLYDIQSNRKQALAEYQAALTTRDREPDTRAAADQGLRQPFTLPKRDSVVSAQSDRESASKTGSRSATKSGNKPAAHADDPEDNAPIDPSGKAEKDAYKPPPPQ